tara:strand:+ start:1475 stop:2020 length:546 start_codon:yes stop_codon:yes gene_type:complete
MSKTLVYIGIGIGVLYLIQRKAKKNFKKALKETAQNLGTQLQEVGNKSVTELQKQTAQSWISANNRRGSDVSNQALDKMTTDFFKSIDDKKTLEIYDKLASEKADIYFQKLENTQGATARKNIVRNLDLAIRLYNITGTNKNESTIIDLIERMAKYMMEEMFKSIKSMPNVTKVSNFDDWL